MFWTRSWYAHCTQPSPASLGWPPAPWAGTASTCWSRVSGCSPDSSCNLNILMLRSGLSNKLDGGALYQQHCVFHKIEYKGILTDLLYMLLVVPGRVEIKGWIHVTRGSALIVHASGRGPCLRGGPRRQAQLRGGHQQDEGELSEFLVVAELLGLLWLCIEDWD